MLEKFKELLKKEKKDILKAKYPKHVAITTDGKIDWSKQNNTGIEESYKKGFLIIKDVINLQVKMNIPILTFYLLSSNMKDLEQFSAVMDTYVSFFNEMKESKEIHENKIKVSVLGKWYDLPGRVVEPIKEIIETTKDYDNFFTNFCINYDGQEEIVDACKLIARQIKADKITPESINKALIKENIYSSYFLPSDLVIRSGLTKKLTDLLLWDSINAKIYFSDKLWPDFDKKDFVKAIESFSK